MKSPGKIFFSFLFSFLASLISSAQPKSLLNADSLEQRIKHFPRRDTLRADALVKLGSVLYSSGKETDFQRSFSLVKESKKISDSLNYIHGKIACFVFYGGHYSQHGDYSLALENDLAALQLMEENGLENERVRLLRNIGTVYHSTHEYEKALQYYSESLSGAKKFNLRNDIAGIESNMGIVFHMMKNYDSALVYYNHALANCEQTGNKRTKSYVLNSLGRMHLDKAINAKDKMEFEKALSFFEQSQELKEKLGDRKGLANVIGNIGEVYKEQKQYALALTYFKEGEKIALQTDYLDWLREGYAGMSDIYEGIGDMKNAYIYYKKHILVRDSLENLVTKERMAKMQGLFDTEKKDKEIELLHKDNELQTVKLGRQNTIIFSGVIGLIAILVFSFFIYRGYREKKKANAIISVQKEEVEEQKKLIEQKNIEMLDSIRYAKHIQVAILPGSNLAGVLGEHFILYKPKDIVSGDFYWVHESGNNIMAAAVDCTGHGVPGAFVSFVGHSSLIRCVNEFCLTDPGKILDQLNILVNETLRQRMSESKVRDGMDMALVVINRETKQIMFAGANNPLYTISDGVLTEIKGNKQPVGTFLEEQNAAFKSHRLELKTGDRYYMFTDGIADQFGGPQHKKFKYKQLKEILVAGASKNLPTQKQILEKAFTDWKGNLEQIDDVLVIGITA